MNQVHENKQTHLEVTQTLHDWNQQANMIERCEDVIKKLFFEGTCSSHASAFNPCLGHQLVTGLHAPILSTD